MRHLRMVGYLVVLLAALLPSPLLASDDPGEELESHGVISDPGLNARIQRVGAGVLLGVRKVNPGFGTRPRFRIVNYFAETGDLNAAALADGRVYATEGLMTVVTSDDELAAVLGHELTHIAEHHHNHQEKVAITAGLAGLAAKALGANDSLQTGVAAVGGLFGARYSKDDEYRADRGMVDALYAGGYDPMAGARLLRTLQGRYGNGPAKIPVIGWFSSHPDTGKRIDGVERRARELRLTGNIGGYETPTPAAPVAAATGKTVVVVVDPEANDAYGGFGSGYYYAGDLSQIAKQETKIALASLGYQVLVSTNDVGPLQDEISLENSEWGTNGENRNPKGDFAGAQEMYYVSAYVLRSSGATVGDWRNQATLAGLKVGALLRRVETRTRKVPENFRGTGSVTAPTQGRFTIRRTVDVDIQSSENLGRKAVTIAVNSALGTKGNTAVKAKPTPAPQRISAPARPVDVEQRNEFTLNIRPKGARADDSRRVVARFEATLTEVMNLNRVHFFRGNMDVAVAEIDYSKSNPESFALEGTLWSPGWEKLNLSGVTSIRLFSRD